ncbi:glycolate oxidase [Halopolyspora algeriensis]|uniref:Glycolate oxidase n=1 Tax=Halopolyspora algeriensis TaxID=1500506 RepID=A0A368VUN3_9ACTN|nr:FAD-linked oxidase C-terminal domain-containing protein [Halopolyspora algeriensis]RCW45816.1 glycolate oxidase [Halopolyspora algeriensis]TQM54200.1 glycolate oxidase [Halopolyspora algeriensis]
MTEPILRELRAQLPDDAILTDPAGTEAYRYDKAGFCTAGTPLAVVRPSTGEQVQHVLRVATRHRVPVVPQGARSGLSGAANAVESGLVLSLSRMNRVLEIDPVDQVAVVEPGVINADLSRAVAGHGLSYPPDPSSWELSTIGGNLATNAGGLCCVKYGVTADFVRALEVVMADGQVLHTGRRAAKGVAGYDLTRLLVGSEGTLGVITKAVLGLRPAPETDLTAAAVFSAAEPALHAVNRIVADRVQPSMLEFLDGTTMRAIQDYRDMGLPAEAEAMVLVQSDRGVRAADDVAAIGRICAEEGAVQVADAADAAESAMLWQARRMVNPAIERLGATLVDDVSVPRSRLAELLDGVARIAGKHDVLVSCPGHVGDGNMHPTVIFDRGDDAAAVRAERAFDAIMQLGLELGGTITGEHGVGLLKRRWLEHELGPLSTSLQHSIKAAFDPLGILNPGKVLD